MMFTPLVSGIWMLGVRGLNGTSYPAIAGRRWAAISWTTPVMGMRLPLSMVVVVINIGLGIPVGAVLPNLLRTTSARVGT